MKQSISVLTTLYNHENFIAATIASALAQTLSPNEIIVIDDASTDGSVQVAAKIEQPSVHVFAETENLGGPNTMKGLSLCRGDLVAILNSDDVWHPDKLRKQVCHLDSNANCGAVFTYVDLIDENNVPWKKGSNHHEMIFQASNRDRHAWLRHFFHVGNAFCASSALIRQECFHKLGPLDGSYAQLQDLEMWVRIAIAGYDLHVIPEKLTYYRIMRNGSNMSAETPTAKSLYTFEYARILRNFWKIKSLEDISKIFPEICISPFADESMVLFYLAQYASSMKTVHHQLFALETMALWGGNLEAMKMASKCHNFTYVSYREFLANGPITKLLDLRFRNKVWALVSPFMSPYVQQKIRSLVARSKKLKFW